jgi:hypothetical protein
MKKHIKRILSYDLLLFPAILLVCVSVGVSIKLDEWRRRRQRVRNSEGVREEAEDIGNISIYHSQHVCGSHRRASDCRDSQVVSL